MSFELKITLSPLASELVKRLRDMPSAGVKIAQAMDRENIQSVSDIKRRISGVGVRRGGSPGEYVGVDTGTLRRSIGASKAIVLASGSAVLEVRSSVGSNAQFDASPVKYAAIHEFGGRIYRRGKKHAYSINIPARPYIGRTIRERLDRYSKAISNAIVKYVIGEVTG